MKNLFILFCVLISISQAISQNVIDGFRTTEIDKAISFNNNTYAMMNLSHCKGCAFAKSLDSMVVQQYFGYTPKADLKATSEYLVGIVKHRLADDVGEYMLDIIVVDTFDNLNVHAIDAMSDFLDIAILDNNTLLIATDTSFRLYTTNGEFIDEIENPGFERIEAIGEEYYGISNDEIQKFTGNIPSSSFSLPVASEVYFLNNLMYLIQEGGIAIMDKDFMEIDFIEFDQSENIVNLTTENEELYILTTNEEYYEVWKNNDSGLSLIRDCEGNHVLYDDIVVNEDEFYLTGSLVNTMTNILEDDYTHAVVSNLHKEYKEYDVSVDITSIDINLDTLDTTIDHLGDTVYITLKDYSFCYSITNHSSEAISNVKVMSNIGGGVNCAKAQYLEFHDTLIMPGEQLDVCGEVNTGYSAFNNFCLAVYSINGQVDANLDNNISCRLLTSSQELPAINKVNVFPNPTTETITFNTENTISKASIYPISGQQVYSISKVNNNSIAVDYLSSGTYVIIGEGKNGDFVKARFVKM